MKRVVAVWVVLQVACGGASVPGPESKSENSEEARLNTFLDGVFDRELARSPERQTRHGIKQDYGKWDDRSDAFDKESHELRKKDLAALRGFDKKKLGAQGKLSYELFEYKTELAIEGFSWRHHNYPVNQMYGTHSLPPAFLINFHRIDNESDAKAYIERLRGIPALFAQTLEGLRTREQLGILPPRFVFDLVLDDCAKIVAGTAMADDFKKKLDAQVKAKTLGGETAKALNDEAAKVLGEQVKPAYQGLISFLEKQREKSTTDDGAWKLPDGDKLYAYRLKRMTTTHMSADEIHDMGLAEVDRIHGEMRAIMKKVEFKGDLPAFFEHLRTDDKFYYPATEEGRQAYLKRAREVIDEINARLGELFVTKPKAALIVKRVEAFREKTAGKAFYSGPAPDGSRPGTYYANLYDMRDMPTYQLEALAYHEAVPGHHMQNALSQQLKKLPKFRRFSGYTAYGEGWGLYSERIPKDMGLYKDPYSDFGRLAMELWRACRLVVDTGIHHKKWTRQQAIDYLMEKTPNPKGDAVRAINRYIVSAGQATAYKIGMNRIMAARARAKKAMGKDFSLRDFHQVVLGSGPVPLIILDRLVDEWAMQTSTRTWIDNQNSDWRPNE